MAICVFPVFLSIPFLVMSSLSDNRRISNNFGAALGLPEEFHNKRQYSLHDVYLEWCQREGIDPEAALVVFFELTYVLKFFVIFFSAVFQLLAVSSPLCFLAAEAVLTRKGPNSPGFPSWIHSHQFLRG